MAKQTTNEKNDLTQARQLIKECLKTQNPYLELGNCGITDLGDLPELFECTHLETLILSNRWWDIEEQNYYSSENFGEKNFLYYVSSKIGNLKNLKTLIICGDWEFDFEITDCYHISTLKSLQTLNLSSTQISDIRFLACLNSLNSLVLNNNEISDISTLILLTSLQNLDLSNNQISDISSLVLLTSLQNLDLSNNQIFDISFLASLTSLQNLELSYNQITDICFLTKLTSLKNLHLSSNRISDISFLASLTSLQELYLSSNQISDFNVIEKLTNLQFLNLRNNQISDIRFLASLTSLQDLYIDNNLIFDISYLTKLTALQSLDLSVNKVSNIKSLENLTALQLLNLRVNKISNISSLEKLKALQYLNLNNNQIFDISPLEKLNALESLNLGYNKISNISSLVNLTTLKSLDLNSNIIKYTEILKNLKNLNYLKITNNPLKDVPESVIENLEYLRIWWKETSNKKKLKPNEIVKLQLIGNGGAGKSSVIEALSKSCCNENQFESTHGIIIKPVKYNIGNKEIKLQTWDFGGQEIYHGTHKLFISSQSLHLIVADEETEKLAVEHICVPDRLNPEEMVLHQPLQHYINLSERQSPESVRLIVKNKTDNENKDDKLLNNATSNQLELICVSATKGIGITELRNWLAEKREDILHYNMLLPVSWLNVQQYFIENLQKNELVRRKLIDTDTFNEICKQFKVSKNSTNTLLDFLHHDGIIYKNEEFLKDYIITDQKWALDAIYKPLDRKSVFYDELRNDFKGRVRIKHLFRAFGEGYETGHKWLFLNFMRSCGLCFPFFQKDKEETEETYYIFPEFLPEAETPAIKEIWKTAIDVKTFIYRTDYLDYFRIQQFIVELGNKTNVEYIWKWGIMLISDKGKFKVEANAKESIVKIHIESTAIDNFLWLIINTFKQSDYRDTENNWFSDDNKLLDLEQLEKRNRRNESFILKLDLNNEEINYTETVRESNSLKSILPDVEQENPKRIVISYASEDLQAVIDLKETLSPYDGKIQLLYDKKIVDGRRQFSPQIIDMFEDADCFIIIVSKKYQNKEIKDYIWKNEFPIIKKKLERASIPVYCLPVAPVIYNSEIAPLACFRKGDNPLPQKGHKRDQYLISFVNEMIVEQFLNKK